MAVRTRALRCREHRRRLDAGVLRLAAAAYRRTDELDRVSTAGFAIGFIGGGVLLLVNLAWILSPSTFGLADTVAGIKLSLASVGVWWLVFTLPLLRGVQEPAVRLSGLGGEGIVSLVRGGTVAAWHTLQELRRSRHAFLMLVAFLIYNDGIQTIIRMSSIYGIEIGIDRNAQIAAFIIVQFVGVPCAFLFGAAASRVGARSNVPLHRRLPFIVRWKNCTPYPPYALLVFSSAPLAPNARHQARLVAGATQERTLAAVACMPWLYSGLRLPMRGLARPWPQEMRHRSLPLS